MLQLMYLQQTKEVRLRLDPAQGCCFSQGATAIALLSQKHAAALSWKHAALSTEAARCRQPGHDVRQHMIAYCSFSLLHDTGQMSSAVQGREFSRLVQHTC